MDYERLNTLSTRYTILSILLSIIFAVFLLITNSEAVIEEFKIFGLIIKPIPFIGHIPFYVDVLFFPLLVICFFAVILDDSDLLSNLSQKTLIYCVFFVLAWITSYIYDIGLAILFIPIILTAKILSGNDDDVSDFYTVLAYLAGTSFGAYGFALTAIMGIVIYLLVIIYWLVIYISIEAGKALYYKTTTYSSSKTANLKNFFIGK
jgi:hypothetical protein